MLAAHDLVDGLDTTRRADTARRALAAALDRAEFEGKPRLSGHVHGVVEDDDAAVTDEPFAGGEGLVVEGRVEQRRRKVGAERTADLDGSDGPARCGAPANRVDQFAERDAERGLEQPAAFDVARELN